MEQQGSQCPRSAPVTRVPQDGETIRILRAISEMKIKMAVVAGGGEAYIVTVTKLPKK